MVAYPNDKEKLARPKKVLAKERPIRKLGFNKPTKLKKPKRRSLLLGPIRSNKGGKIINKYKGGTLYVASFYD
tara:strand:+ start:83 stop:301 length:219 start_codon:yes stop_codon:yes gene_type:complete